MWGRVLAERFLFTKKSNAIKIIECCCILINYYCWQAPSAYLPSRARRMTSFVKISCSVGVERLPPRPVPFVVGPFFHFWNRYFYAQAQCPSVGWSWRASRMTTFFKNSSVSWEVYRFLRCCLPGPSQSDVLYIVFWVYGANCVNHRVFMFLCLIFWCLISYIFVTERVVC